MEKGFKLTFLPLGSYPRQDAPVRGGAAGQGPCARLHAQRGAPRPCRPGQGSVQQKIILHRIYLDKPRKKNPSLKKVESHQTLHFIIESVNLNQYFL
jgi:hypothetical protein